MMKGPKPLSTLRQNDHANTKSQSTKYVCSNYSQFSSSPTPGDQNILFEISVAYMPLAVDRNL